jgi:cellulose synthase/poly-beta-1,6-N-acetylglucosamine synthase-like glycosyltransferase
MHIDSASKETPTFSVVVAAYNAAATIGATLDAVLTQTCQDFEIIVVDDGSTDDTASRVRPYLIDHRVRLHRQRNQGPSAARNAGIALASGEYVCMLDSDDLWLPHYLTSMKEGLKQARTVGFAFTRSWDLDQTTNRIRKFVSSPPDGAMDNQAAFLRALIEHNFIPNSTTVRREVLDRVGGFDPELLASEDYDLYLRIVSNGYAAAYVPGPSWIWRDRPGSLTDDPSRMLIGLQGALTKALANYRLPPEVAAVARSRVVAVERQLAALDRVGRVPAWLAARHAVGYVTRAWRPRRACFRNPPGDVAAAFPDIGRGHDFRTATERARLQWDKMSLLPERARGTAKTDSNRESAGSSAPAQ